LAFVCFKNSGISTIVWQYKNRLIVSIINFASGYIKQVRKICASLQTVNLRQNANSIITVFNGPIGCAVTNFAVRETIFAIPGYSCNVPMGL
jgi:hypothetical protein